MKSSLVRCGIIVSALSWTNAQAYLLNTPVQQFVFGPDEANFNQTATLETFNQTGALMAVHVELSGMYSFALTAVSGDNPGTVLGMTEDLSFSLEGLPFAALSTGVPTFSVGSFPLAANSSQSFIDSGAAPAASVDLFSLFQLAAYDVSVGAPTSIDFTFLADESFAFSKSGSGLAAGSDATATGKARIWYTYDNFLPPPSMPETTTALSAAGFAVLSFLALRNHSVR